MVAKARGEFVHPTEQINLTVQFNDGFGNPIDADSFPQIAIIQPSGNLLLSPTSAGVMRVSEGHYQYTFTVPLNGPYGVFNDIWIGYVGGNRVENTFSFIVSYTQFPEVVNSDGYAALGDDPGFNYSQTSIQNINKLLKTLKARLNSSGKVRTKDEFGNVIFVDCDIYSTDQLVTFLANSLTDFNQIPFFTNFTFDDTPIIDQFHDILVEGATLSALASKALIERGLEYTINNASLTFTPPTMSELLNTQYNTLLTQYYEKVKYIKNSMRPASLGLGVFSALASNPIALKLRHLRARRII